MGDQWPPMAPSQKPTRMPEGPAFSRPTSALTMIDASAPLQTYREITQNAKPSVLLVPSVRAVLDWIRSDEMGEGTIVVGRAGFSGMQSPAALLATLLHNPDARPTRVAIFTDQLVSARDATVQVHRDSSNRFLSALEFILNNEYQYPLYAVNGGALAYLADSAPLPIVLNFTLAHLDAADTFGNDWLAREQQKERTPESRRAQRRKYVRAMQSTILSMMGSPGFVGLHGAVDKLNALSAIYSKD
jgi:hypothetical protein